MIRSSLNPSSQPSTNSTHGSLDHRYVVEEVIHGTVTRICVYKVVQGQHVLLSDTHPTWARDGTDPKSTWFLQ